jgi:T-complex protein 1 subunit theta
MNSISVQIVPKNAQNFNVDNIRVVKVIGAGIGASTVVNGMMFKRGAEGEIKSVDGGARVIVFACPFDLTQTETKVCWSFSTSISIILHIIM